MKSKIAALSLLLATVGGQAALAQDHDHDRDRGDRPQQGSAPGATAPQPPAARPQPQAAPQERGGRPGFNPGARREGERPQGERPQGERPQAERPQGGGRDGGQAPIPSQSWSGGHARYGAPPPDGQRGDRGRPGDGRPGDGRQGHERQGDGRPGDGRPDGQSWNRGDHNGADRNGDGRPDLNRGDRNGDGRPDWNRGQNNGDNRNWNRGGDNHGRPQWDRRRYPPVYRSQHRYRGPAWYPPVGFYAHDWAFGEIFPQAWISDQYVLEDWWNYDLPEPPPGYDWVRVGADALLIDSYSGRIVQVVRAIFW